MEWNTVTILALIVLVTSFLQFNSPSNPYKGGSLSNKSIVSSFIGGRKYKKRCIK